MILAFPLSMSTIKVAARRLLASAGKRCMAGGALGSAVLPSAVFMSAVMLAALASQPAISSPLSDEIQNAGTETTIVSSDTANVSKDAGRIIEQYKLTNADNCAMLVVGVSTTNSVPIYFIPGPIPIGGIDGDLMSDIPITGITTGPEAALDGKNVSGAPIAGGERFIVFGVNLTNMTAGAIAIASLDTSNSTAGPHILSLANFGAADTKGNSVPLCVTTGIVTK
jgi:hypothetical protein